jgi:hypothetical protein
MIDVKFDIRELSVISKALLQRMISLPITHPEPAVINQVAKKIEKATLGGQAKVMRYLVVPKDREVFMSFLFEPENNWSDDHLVAVIDLHRMLVMKDGERWEEIEMDNL